MIEVPLWLRIIVATILFVSIWAAVVAIEQVGLDHTLSKIQPWQGLIGAGLALVAAIWTIQTMRSESAASDRRHDEQLKRKRLAARSQMPDSLVQVVEYCHECIRYLVGDTQTPPAAPITGINTLKSVIEHINDDAAARTFELVSWYQVQNSRLFGKDENTFYLVGEDYYDTVLLHALAESLFDYARNKSQTVSNESPSLDEMNTNAINAFRYASSLHFDLKEIGLQELIERRHTSKI